MGTELKWLADRIGTMSRRVQPRCPKCGRDVRHIDSPKPLDRELQSWRQLGSAATRTLRVFAAIILMLIAFSAQAQSLPAKKEVRKWIEEAMKASVLQSVDAPPYHFVAKIRYTLGDKNPTLDGTYEVLWAAPDRYRVEFRLGNTGETDVVLGDKKYVERNTPTMTLAMRSVSEFLFSSVPPGGFVPDESVHELSSTGDGPTREICAKVGGSTWLKRQFCFDAATSELISQHLHPSAPSSELSTNYSFDLTDYMTLGKIRFPKHLKSEYGPERIDVSVDKLDAVQSFGENLFAPLPKGTVWDWCLSPKIQTPITTSPSPTFPLVRDPSTDSRGIPYVGMYMIVGADGVARQVTELYGPAERFVKDLLYEQRHERAPLHVCNGKPIEYETIVKIWPLGPL